MGAEQSQMAASAADTVLGGFESMAQSPRDPMTIPRRPLSMLGNSESPPAPALCSPQRGGGSCGSGAALDPVLKYPDASSAPPSVRPFVVRVSARVASREHLLCEPGRQPRRTPGDHNTSRDYETRSVTSPRHFVSEGNRFICDADL